MVINLRVTWLNGTSMHGVDNQLYLTRIEIWFGTVKAFKVYAWDFNKETWKLIWIMSEIGK